MKKIIFIVSALILSTKLSAQVGINTDTPQASLEIKAQPSTSTSAVGLLIPRISQQTAEDMTNPPNSTMVFIDELSTISSPVKTSNIQSTGYYYYNSNKNIWVNVNDRASFFYSPSILLPTEPTDSRILDTSNQDFKYENDEYIINLYSIFKKQFQSPVAYSTNADLSRFVKGVTDYDYYVTYSDPEVFILAQDGVSTNGILKYKVNPNSIIRNGSFMNIVIAEN